MGSYILEELYKESNRTKFNYDSIRLLVRNLQKAEVLEDQYDNLEIVKGDLTDFDSLHRATQDVDTVIHTAALFNTRSKKAEFMKSNVDATREIKSQINVPVVYLTGNADSRTFQRAGETRHLGYLIKPVSRDNLKSVISTALQRHILELEQG